MIVAKFVFGVFIINLMFDLLVIWVSSFIMFRIIKNELKNIIEDKWFELDKLIKGESYENKILEKDNTNSILDNIAELNGMISISAGKVCKILDIVDAKDKAYIKATDTCKSDQSIKTRKAKNSSHSKKVTTIHCNKNIAK